MQQFDLKCQQTEFKIHFLFDYLSLIRKENGTQWVTSRFQSVEIKGALVSGYAADCKSVVSFDSGRRLHSFL